MEVPRGFILQCWDCHQPIEEPTSEQVRTNPHLPEWMSNSTTRVCVDCALKRIAEGVPR